MTLRFFPLPLGPARPSHDPAHNVIGGWVVTSYFGGRIDPIKGVPGRHGGMDIAGVTVFAQPLVAVIDGVVGQAWDPTGGGWWTSLTGPDGTMFGYGHADHYADPDGPGPAANYNGRAVSAGTVLGYVGTTGASTGAHLHFAYRPAGASSYADPFDLLIDASAGNRFVGVDPGPYQPPVSEVPSGTPHDDPSNPVPEEDPEMIICMLDWPDKPDVEVLGLDSAGWWRKHLDNTVEVELLRSKGVGVRHLAVGGSEELDALYESARQV